MQNRVSLYPGRVKMIPVPGQADTYDMIRADQPTQEGNPLSKETFLKDATAALYGLLSTAVPDDVFVAIKTKLEDALELVDTKAKIETGSYVGTGYSISRKLIFGFKPYVVFILDGTANASNVCVFANPSKQCITTLSENPKLTSWNDDGITLYKSPTSSGGYMSLNISGQKYYYIALG